jgi:hypothetical protein
MPRVAQQCARVVEECEVVAPTVDADAGHMVRGSRHARGEAVGGLPVQRQNVPVQPIRDADGSVGESVRLSDADAVVDHRPDKDPPALGAEINRCIHGHPASLVRAGPALVDGVEAVAPPRSVVAAMNERGKRIDPHRVTALGLTL